MTESAGSKLPYSDAQRTEQGAWVPPFLVALAGWLLPGAGYWLIGQRTRGTISGLAILLLFVAGIFIGGIRVVDVPGYAEGGVKMVGRDGRWMLLTRPMPTVLAKPWYIGQVLAGPVTLAAGYFSIEAASRQYPKGTAHVAEFGTLYCAVAGMLNLLIILDSTARATAGGGDGGNGKS
jgi:hypothetical protein